MTTNPDEELDGDDRYDFEVVRCICEVQEENDFMIQVGSFQETGTEKHKLALGGNFEGLQLKASKSSHVRSPDRQFFQQQIELCFLV